MRNKCLVAVGRISFSCLFWCFESPSVNIDGFGEGGMSDVGSRLSQSKSHEVLGKLGLNSYGFLTK